MRGFDPWPYGHPRLKYPESHAKTHHWRNLLLGPCLQWSSQPKQVALCSRPLHSQLAPICSKCQSGTAQNVHGTFGPALDESWEIPCRMRALSRAEIACKARIPKICLTRWLLWACLVLCHGQKIVSGQRTVGLNQRRLDTCFTEQCSSLTLIAPVAVDSVLSLMFFRFSTFSAKMAACSNNCLEDMQSNE